MQSVTHITTHPWRPTEAWKSLKLTFPVRKSEWFCAAVLFGCAMVLVMNPQIMSQQPAYAAMLRFADQDAWMWALMVLSCGRLVALVINGAWRHSPHARAFFAFLAGFAWWQILAGLVPNAGFGLCFAAGFFVQDAFNFRQALLEAFIADGVREVVRRNASASVPE